MQQQGRRWIMVIGGGLTALMLTTCSWLGAGEEDIPAYLYIRPFESKINTEVYGSSSHRVTEAWLTVDGLFLGAYDLPARVPVLAEGATQVRIEAGIRENGIARTPDIYPFYAPFTTTLELRPMQVDTLQPVLRYLPETKVAFIEDFEADRPRVFTRQLLGSTGLEVQSQVVFEGQAAGRITLTAQQPVVELASADDYSELLTNNAFVYLEVNYRAEAPVVFGVVGTQGSDPPRFFDPGFAARDSWNKIYFNLSGVVFNSQLDRYRIALQAFLTDGQQRADIYLDNIKLLYF